MPECSGGYVDASFSCCCSNGRGKREEEGERGGLLWTLQGVGRMSRCYLPPKSGPNLSTPARVLTFARLETFTVWYMSWICFDFTVRLAGRHMNALRLGRLTTNTNLAACHSSHAAVGRPLRPAPAHTHRLSPQLQPRLLPCCWSTHPRPSGTQTSPRLRRSSKSPDIPDVPPRTAPVSAPGSNRHWMQKW